MKFAFKRAYNPVVFYSSVALILGILILSLIFPKTTLEYLKFTQTYLGTNFGWFYVLSVTVIFFVMVFLAFSKYGEIKLGLDHSKPQFSNLSWFAMLFSAGMGIGIMFFGVAEPLMHYLSPPNAQPQTIEAAKEALHITLFHWGLNAWAIYGIVAIILAFFAYRHNLPLTLRSAFYPLIGDRIYGKFGDLVDVFAVIATLFGVTTSLGYGVLQVSSGFSYIFGIESSVQLQLILIFAIIVLVTISATSGLDRGIKILSNTNIVLAILFLVLILVLGNTTGLLKSLIENTGRYLTSFIGDTFNLYAYDKKNDAWLGGWTILYWTWWLSWSPFVGLFIARISRGRTIREFVTGVLFVPAGFSAMWMTFFGNSAIDMLNNGFSELGKIATSDVSLALFVFLEKFPFSTLLSGVAVFMIVLFFITSADSAAMVIDMLCSRGKDNTPKWQKIFWCILIGVVSAILLGNGGLEALQTMTMLSALPLTIALLGSIYGLLKALSVDVEKKMTQQASIVPSIIGGSKNWKERLAAIIDCPDRDDAKDFFQNVVRPALDEICAEFNRNNLGAKIVEDVKKSKIHIQTQMGDEYDFIYGIRLLKSAAPDYAQLQDTYYRAEVYLKEGGQDYDVIGWSKEALLNDIIEQYRKHMHFLHKTR